MKHINQNKSFFTAIEIAKEILYYPVTNNKSDDSIAKLAKLIQQFSERQHQATIDKVVELLQQSIKHPRDTKSQSTVGWNNAIDNILTKIKTLTP